MTTSNPSPRYVEAVAAAFTSGSYAPSAGSSLSFSGKYGDLGATFAAILLDPEARSLTLDDDPTFGRMREPVLKLFHVMRALDYVDAISPNHPVGMRALDNLLGQEVYRSESVFKCARRYNPWEHIHTHRNPQQLTRAEQSHLRCDHGRREANASREPGSHMALTLVYSLHTRPFDATVSSCRTLSPQGQSRRAAARRRRRSC